MEDAQGEHATMLWRRSSWRLKMSFLYCMRIIGNRTKSNRLNQCWSCLGVITKDKKNSEKLP